METIAISEDGTLLASGGLDNQIILTAMEVPVEKLEDIPVDMYNDPWTEPKIRSRERTISNSKLSYWSVIFYYYFFQKRLCFTLNF